MIARRTNTASPPPPDAVRAPPDPLAVAEQSMPRQPLSRVFPLATEGTDNALDALQIITKLLTELLPDERRAVLEYVRSRFPVVPS